MTELRSKRIAIVIELAQKEQDNAAQRFQQMTQLCEAQKQKLAELEQYYAFYEQRSMTFAAGVRASQLSQSRSFLGQLNLAIQQQQQQLSLVEQNVVEAQKSWHTCYLKVQSLQELQQRYQKEEAAERDRREQKVMDEWVSQRAGNPNSNE